MRFSRPGLPAALLMVTLLAAGVWFRTGRAIPAAPMNVVLITLDTLRADHVGAYGATTVKTPHLDRLASQGVVFDQAMTAAPLTLPAHSSIMTGQFPPRHGVRDNGGFFLAPAQVTLAEILTDRGYQTGATVGAFVLDSKWGLDQGFGTYQDDFDLTGIKAMSLASVKRPGNEVVDLALRWMEGVADQRFFAWLHLYDPHAPYESPEPYRSQYRGHPYRGAIAFTDAQVGRVVDFLEARGLSDNTIVIVTADHGEGLGEHGEDTHGFFVYETSMRVPLIVRVPGGGIVPGRVTQPVRTVDILPTVLDLLGTSPPAPIEGVSLVPLMSGATRALALDGYGEAMYPLHHYGWSELTTLRSDRYKLIDAPRPELYDLERDPNELVNLFDERRPVADAMLRQLRERTRVMDADAPEAPKTEDVDPETRARLAALGYVGSFVATSSEPSSGRADPKDKIGLFNLMTTARDVAREADAGVEAIAMLRSVVAEDPQVIDAWFMLGNEYFKQSKWTEAIAQFRRALELKPDYDLAIINMANAYRRLGQDDAALAGYEHYVTIDPKNAYVQYQIGEIHMDRRDLARAEAAFAQALSIDPKLASARVATGVLAFERGQLPQAEQLLKEALTLKPDVRLAHYNLALIAEVRGNDAAAEASYRAELERHPTAFKASFNLGRLKARQGQAREATAWYQQSIDTNAEFAEGYFYLAKAKLDEGRELDQAVSLARKGLALQPEGETSPLGHFVIGGVLMKQGRPAEAERELARGLALEARLAKRP
ncbi:MAG: sulfatase-like hydrolase/transferase [Acidobacteriota bacterium]|nr:sulfatase-like hydrolase/transferase [Acidobacteriota bacterium]